MITNPEDPDILRKRLARSEKARQEAEAIAERTTRDLYEALKEVRRSNEELEQFAYVASHDLREPLRMITSYLGLLEKRFPREIDQDAREFIGFAIDGANRMGLLIDGLLRYAHVDMKGTPPVPVALDDVLDHALKNLEVQVAEARGTISRTPLPEVRGDKAQLEQLLQNLVSNAIKFCREARPEVSISARKEGGDWEIAVRDNGIGIDPSDAGRIFQIFQRLHTREEFAGAGIGLALCKKIVERHGGRIWLESAGRGHGAVLKFTLPSGQRVPPMRKANPS